MYFYRAFSLNVTSELDFPELSKGFENDTTDLQIVLGKTPLFLDGPNVITKVRNQSTKNKFLINIENAGKIFITDGKKIMVEPAPHTDIELIKSYILTRAFAAALHQKKWTPIHASAIKVKNKAILFAGDSGAGKSTTVSAFVKKGYPFISDDICIIKKEDNQRYKVFPSYPQMRLWEDSIDLMGVPEYVKNSPIRQKINKFSVRPTSEIVSTPLEISHIYILRWKQHKTEQFISLDNLQKLQILRSLTYAKGQLDGLGGTEDQFKTLGYLIKTCVIKIIEQPMIGKDIWRLNNTIEQDFLSEIT